MQGFYAGEWEQSSANGDTGSRSTTRPASGNTPKGAGLKDGAVLACRWQAAHNHSPSGDGDNHGDGDGVLDRAEENGGDAKADGEDWGVMFPRYEDSDGEVTGYNPSPAGNEPSARTPEARVFVRR